MEATSPPPVQPQSGSPAVEIQVRQSVSYALGRHILTVLPHAKGWLLAYKMGCYHKRIVWHAEGATRLRKALAVALNSLAHPAAIPSAYMAGSNVGPPPFSPCVSSNACSTGNPRMAPSSCATTNAAASAAGISPATHMANVTAGSTCAPPMTQSAKMTPHMCRGHSTKGPRWCTSG